MNGSDCVYDDLVLIDFYKPWGVSDVTFYFGKSGVDYSGMGWDKRPYEDVAGVVNPALIVCKRRFVDCKGALFQPFNWWSKNDLKNRLTPCIVFVPRQVFDKEYHFKIEDINKDDNIPWPLFDYCIGHEDSVKIYLGDTYKRVCSLMEKYV